MQANPIVTIGQGAGAVRFGNDQRLSVMAGPCALESRQHALE
ncbi:MAG: 3-deoxy-8-phosphooctulonate synthase, partial [Methylocystaceae bacterium]|nr:3-deoxy-8-phosphooctulonate synthase [Methylocystaceae bacterium]